jgi:FAD/FMN-containing dehydrogenase
MPATAAPDVFALATTDLGVRESFAQDASGLALLPEAVARPTTADEVVAVLREAHAGRTPVTPAGALTGYAGGALSDRGVILSLRAMDRVLDVDARAGVIRAEAGALLGDVKRVAAERGLLLAPDPTSEEECSVGGAVAANASGARSLKYGATRPHVRRPHRGARRRHGARVPAPVDGEEHGRLPARPRPGGLVRRQRGDAGRGARRRSSSSCRCRPP